MIILDKGVSLGYTAVRRSRDSEKEKCEIVYVTENEGKIVFPSGETRTLDGEKYRDFLERFIKAKAEEGEEVIDPGAPTMEPPKPLKDQETPKMSYTPPEKPPATVAAEDEKLLPAEKTGSGKGKQKKKLSKGTMVALVLVGILAVTAVALLVVKGSITGSTGTGQAAAADTGTSATGENEGSVTIAVTAAEIPAGTAIKEGDLSAKTVSRETYELLKTSIYAGESGAEEATVMTWEEAKNLIGGTALRTLSAGTAVTAMDIAAPEAETAESTEARDTVGVRIYAEVTPVGGGEPQTMEIGQYYIDSDTLAGMLAGTE